jgi:hypothetical protein
MQLPQPSPHLLRALSLPLCSTHPGQAQRSPHEHPDSAKEAICLMGGMIPKLGIDGAVLRADDPDEDDDAVYARGGRCTLRDQDDWSFLWCLYRDSRGIGGFGSGRARNGLFPIISDEGASIRLEEGGMLCIATAAVASADKPLAMTRCCEGDFSAVQLHFNRLLQLQGFRRASTMSLVND